MGKKIDITGEKFERLTAIRPVYKNGKRMWECRCDCGTVKNFTLQDLKSGRVKSCGCYNREKASKWMSQLKYKRNKYETVDDYIIGYTSNKNSPFYIDVEDYDKVKRLLLA